MPRGTAISNAVAVISCSLVARREILVCSHSLARLVVKNIVSWAICFMVYLDRLENLLTRIDLARRTFIVEATATSVSEVHTLIDSVLAHPDFHAATASFKARVLLTLA